MSPVARIGLVCPYSFDQPGGVQNHVVGLAGFLERNGYRAEILAPGRPSKLLDSTLAEAGLPADRFTSAGPAVPVPYNGSVARVNFGPASAARVRSWLRRCDFDLLHLHEPITPSVSMLTLWASAAPVVATFHTATPRSRSMRLAGGMLRGSIDKINTGIAVSESAREVVRRYLGRDAIVVPNGFSHAEFAEPAEAERPWRGGDRPRIAFLGRLDEPRKGLGVLLAALPAIRTGARQLGIDDIEIVIAGQTRRGAPFPRRGQPLPPDCRGLGLISNTERADLLGTTDVFVAPHRARESFGIVLLEAMASGAPIVASDLPAFVDLLRDNRAGRGDGGRLGELFPAGDPDRLATAVVATLADRSVVRQRSHRARSASRDYDWAAVGPRVAEIYDQTLKRIPSLVS